MINRALARLATRPAGRFALLAAILAAPALVIATQLYVGYRMRGIRLPFGALLLTQLAHWEIWTIAGPLVWRLQARWPVTGPNRLRHLAHHVLAAPAVAIGVIGVHYLAYHMLIRLPGISLWFTGIDRSLSLTAIFFTIQYMHLELLLYAGVVAIAHAFRATALLRAKEHESLRLEAELTGARLRALRTQLQPHFLFNALHMIGSSVLQRQNERAVQMLAELGELLRATLAQRDTELAPLRDELTYLRRYLRIEEARFGDRLRIDWHIDEATLDRLVPPFILQPLIENAFRHRIAHRTEHSQLSITTALDNGSLHIEIYNDGPPIAQPPPLDAGGYGLQNVAERLRTRTPAGRLEIANRQTGVCATLKLPRWELGEAAPREARAQ